MQDIATDAGDEIANDIFSGEDQASPDADELGRIVSANESAGLKHQLTNLNPSSRESSDAYLSLYRRTVEENGGKKIIQDKPLQIEGRELREHRFVITNTNYQKAERFMVRSTFGEGPEVAHSFGEQPLMWQFSGLLRRGNRPARLSQQTNNWWQALEALYANRLRASLLMRNNEFVHLRVGKLRMRGYITNLTTQASERNDDAAARFQFSMYVRSYTFAGNYQYQPSSEKLAADRPDPGAVGNTEDVPATGPSPGTVA